MISVDQLIDENLIIMDLDAKNKDDVLFQMMNLIHESKKLNCIWKKDNLEKCQECTFCYKNGFLDALKERERLFSTSVGFSFAIPHGKCNSVGSACIAFSRLNNEILWEDDEMVKYIFMIGVSDSDASNEHLEILIKLSTSILDDDFRDCMEKAKTKADILEIIKKYTSNDKVS